MITAPCPWSTAAFGEHGMVVARLSDALRQYDPDAPVTRGKDQRQGTQVQPAVTQAELVVGHAMFSRGLLDAPRRLVPVQVSAHDCARLRDPAA
jgi:putative acetyltransferase